MTSHERLPDAAPANWVDRLAPAPWRPWLRLGRFDRPTGIWLLMLPGWQGVALHDAAHGRWPNPGLLALFALGAALMRAAGCAYNDIVDKDLDAKVARTAARPVASGAIGVGPAAAFAIACALGGLFILLQLNLMSLFLGVASLVLIAAYPFMKRLTWWPQAWLGLTFNWGILLGWAAAEGGAPGIQALALAARAWSSGINLILYTTPLPAAAFLLYASAALWTVGYDTIYAVQDLEDDALAGVKSSARRLGAATQPAVFGFYAASLILAFLAWRAAGLGIGFLPLWALYGAQLAWQGVGLRVGDPAGALRRFKSNTLAALILLAAIVAGG
ncbi:MAG TPA: 4-hydroxybenzoate octaprenyltransferase [Caulobacteraceae bacterium]|jgi:4-hydroxybenzoate polyprenyltransferase|nr:4-hydroxybenzoate octaprenyltransferase [Caulobacteraceae bacterium]